MNNKESLNLIEETYLDLSQEDKELKLKRKEFEDKRRDLNTRMEVSKEKVYQLNKQIEQQNKLILKLSPLVKEHESNVQAMENTEFELSEQCTRRAKKIASIQKSIKSFEKKRESLQQRFIEQNLELKRIEQSYLSLKSQKARLKADLHSLRIELNGKRALAQEKLEGHERLKVEVSELKKSLYSEKVSEREISEMNLVSHETLKGMRKKKKELNHELIKNETALLEVQGKLGSTASELAIITDVVGQLSEEIALNDKQKSHFRELLVKSTSILETIRSAVDELGETRKVDYRSLDI